MTDERTVPIEPFLGWIERHVAEQNALIDSCHERVACPKCEAPVGERCCRMPRGWQAQPGDTFLTDTGWLPSRLARVPNSGAMTKHPHQERWTQVVPAR